MPKTVMQGAEYDKGPWWREPYCWLVIVGPLVVVFAGIATTVIAYQGADALKMAPPVGQAKLDSYNSIVMQPAQAARNGAALVKEVP